VEESKDSQTGVKHADEGASSGSNCRHHRMNDSKGNNLHEISPGDHRDDSMAGSDDCCAILSRSMRNNRCVVLRGIEGSGAISVKGWNLSCFPKTMKKRASEEASLFAWLLSTKVIFLSCLVLSSSPRRSTILYMISARTSIVNSEGMPVTKSTAECSRDGLSLLARTAIGSGTWVP
jgi:hypothetical protein